VSFGSKNSLVETWIIEDSALTHQRRGDVREIGYDFYDDTMTSSTDVMVASNKTPNHKPPNRHVTIGDSTVVIVTPRQTPDTPDSEGGRHSLGHTAVSAPPGAHLGGSSVGAAGGSSYHQHCAHSTVYTPLRITKVSAASRPNPRQLSPRVHQIRPKKEEYYDVIHPEPKDQT
ncbi:hypothetical protein BgiBS90_025363, partial [Biomphalaria glabrata]